MSNTINDTVRFVRLPAPESIGNDISTITDDIAFPASAAQFREVAVMRRTAQRMANRFYEIPGEAEANRIAHAPDAWRHPIRYYRARMVLSEIALRREIIGASLPKIDNLEPGESAATIEDRFAAFIENPEILSLDLARTPDNETDTWKTAHHIQKEFQQFAKNLGYKSMNLIPVLPSKKYGLHAEVLGNDDALYLWDNRVLGKIAISNNLIATIGSRQEVIAGGLSDLFPVDMQRELFRNLTENHGRLTKAHLEMMRRLIEVADDSVRHQHTAIYCYRQRPYPRKRPAL